LNGFLHSLSRLSLRGSGSTRANNVYDVVVQVRDGDGGVDTQALAVSVTNVNPEAVIGDGGANSFVATTDSEFFFGLGGSDTVSYASAHAGVTASLANMFSNRGEAAGDFYNSIENLTGSAFNDRLTGDLHANVLEGGAGADRLDGGWGSDTASYAHAAAAVTADLSKSANNTGEAAGDTYLSIENLLGSKFNDRLVGDNFNNVLTGGDGQDTLIANAGNDKLIGGLGADTLNGGAGRDLFAYFAPNEGGDTIQSYVVKDDTLQFSASGFGGGRHLHRQHRAGGDDDGGDIPLRHRRP
jgi:Ca2+-binding RTX toxin-like protein